MPITRFKTQYFPTVILIVVGILLYLLSCGDMATAFDFHADSAHGNDDPAPGYGVNRSAVDYPTGDCAHCHDTFDSSTCSVNHRMLFRTQFDNQSSGFCISCHRGANGVQEGGYINNYDYSTRRGGKDEGCPESIREAFKFINNQTREPQMNCGSEEGSAHDLKNIRAYMKNEWEWGGTNAEVNPCGTCHNPHQATKEYPCSKPSSHSGTWEIWGDDPVDSGKNEKMADYLDTGEMYQPPYKVGSTPEEPKYERDADIQPNYVEFCLECHQYPQNSYQHGTVTAIDWENADMGKAEANRDWSPLKPPYDSGSFGKYVLCCTDCHEPHGSRNEWLLRTEVNGTIIEMNEAREWWDFCTACHEAPHNWSAPPPIESSRNCYGGIGLDACHQHFRVGYGF